MPEALRAEAGLERVREQFPPRGRGVVGASGGGSGDCGFAFEVGGTGGRGALRKRKARPVFAIPDKESRSKSGADCGGIPVGTKPIARRGIQGWEQYLYARPAGAPLVVSHHPRDADHPCPHWHTGTAKLDDEGNVQRFSNGAWRYRNEGNAFLHRFN